MGNQQLWQQLRPEGMDKFIGAETAVMQLRMIESGFVLIEGPVGCGKTRLALAWAKERFGVDLKEQQTIYRMDEFYLQHLHAQDFDMDILKQKQYFFWGIPTMIIVDEAQDLYEKRQQSKLKTIPQRPDLTLVLVTQNPEELEKSIRDRCSRIRLGPLNFTELKPMVERACAFRGIPCTQELLRALNKAQVFRPRAILNVIDSVSRGVPVESAVVGQ